MAFCSNCGKELIGDPDMCVNCGVVLKKEKAPQYHATQHPVPPAPAPQYQAPQYPQQQYPQQPYQQQYPQQPYPQQQYANQPYAQNQYGAAAYGVSDKTKMMVAILAFFLGTLGIHRFYVGKTGTGIAMAALTIVGYITGFLFVFGFILVSAVGLWVLVDFIMALMGKFTDKYGRPIVN
jgi:TM2 domain-containing membrane protein YozV